MEGSRWSTNRFFPEKLVNFHSCVITFGDSFQGEASFYEMLDNGAYEFGGFNVQLIEILAGHLNFRTIFVPHDEEHGGQD